MIRVEPYASRFWSVWRGKELLAVTVYRKGARRVAEELTTRPGPAALEKRNTVFSFEKAKRGGRL